MDGKPAAPAPNPPANAPANAPTNAASVPWAWLIAGAVAAALAYRPLLSFQPERSLPEELEEWFFVPSETIAPLVVLLAGWLLYRRSARLRALAREPGSLATGVGLLVIAIGAHAWATWTAASDLLPISLMLCVAAGAWLWRGGPAVRVASLPIAFLGFAMAMPSPLLNEIVFRLQIETAELAGVFLYALGIPHFVAGEQIQRTEQLFSVIESCSGLRSIEILSMVAILMADLFRRGRLHAWLLVLVAPVLAFFLNGLRALLLILNPHSEVAAIHNLQGVAILLAGLVVLFVLDGLLDRLPARSVPTGPPAVGGAGPHRLGAPLFAVSMLMMAGVGLALPPWQPEARPRVGIGELSTGLGFSEEREIDRLFLGSTVFREAIARSVRWGRRDAMVFVGVGARENRSRSPLSPKTGLPGSGWVTEQESVLQLEGAGADPGREVRTRVMRSGSRRWLVHHWYEGAASFPEEVLRAWLALDRSPWRRSEEIVAVRIGVPLSGAVEESRPVAEAEFLSFYRVLRPLLTRLGAQAAGKKFSAFRSSGKTFSAWAERENRGNPMENRYLQTLERSARYLLIPCVGATGAPRGSGEDLRSLG